MPFVYANVKHLEGAKLIGEGDCVDLIKRYAPGLRNAPTSAWRAGERVVDAKNLAPGTAIATFVNGRYPTGAANRHAALFVASGGQTIYVMDQWKDDPKFKPKVSERPIRPGLSRNGHLEGSMSNASQFFYVIEIKK